MNLTAAAVRMMVGALITWALLTAPALEAQERAPLLMEGKATLFQRVLTHPGAGLRTEPAAAAAAQEVPPFTAFYVFDRKVIDGQNWVQVGSSSRGPAQGWLDARETVDWKQTLTLAFTNRVGRDRVLLFQDRDRLLELLESESLMSEVNSLRQAIAAGQLPENFPVIAIEPETHIYFAEQFYLLPILSAEEAWLSSGFTTRLLEIASIPLQEGTPGSLSGPASASAGQALRDYRVAVGFVMDTTISMQPYIERAREAVRKIYGAIESAGLLSKVSFGLVGFRDNLVASPQGEYLAKVFADFKVGVDPKAFLDQVAGASAATASNRGFVEDSYAGLLTAINDLGWKDYGGRIMVLITDAGARAANDPLGATGMDTQQIRQLALDQGIAVYTLHLLTEEGRANHASAESQYQALSEFPNIGSLYFPVDAGSVDQFGQNVEVLAQALVSQVADAMQGKIITEPSPDRVQIAQAGGDVDAVSTEAAAGPAQPAVSWHGLDADCVGTYASGAPDGRPDGHFRMGLDLGAGREISSITLMSSKLDGTPTGLTWNTADNNSYWVLGVYRGQELVNPQRVPTLGQFEGATTLDLYAADAGGFRESEHYAVLVKFGDGEEAKQVIALGLSTSGSGSCGSPTSTTASSAPGANPAPSFASSQGGLKPASQVQKIDIEAKTQLVGRVMQLAYLGRKMETGAPRLFRAWASDRDFQNPDTPTLEVRVLLTKNQVSDLQQVLKAIVEGGEAASSGSGDFFNQIKSASAAMGRDPTLVGRESARNLAELGLMGEYLDDLPYRSKIMSIDEDLWHSWSINEQQQFLDEIKAKIRLYQEYHDDTDRWIALDDGQVPGDAVYPVPLEALP